MKRRDPRIDPQDGDVLVQTRRCIDSVRTFRRTVLHAFSASARLSEIVKTVPNCPYWVVYSVKDGACSAVLLDQWRKWARGAKVERKA